MEDYTTQSFIMGFTRFSCEVGYPKTLLCDAGSQLIKGCQDMRLNYLDIKHQLFNDHKVEFEVCPVGGHNEHGKVERKIREITLSIDVVHKYRLSMLQWETFAASIANNINNMPLATNGIIGDLENLDILTPNRLKMGRNNERSPVEPVEQKWLSTSDVIKVGDIVLFLKHDSKISSTYQYGLVVGVEFGSDGLVRRANVRYKNSNEDIFRETRRSTRTLVIIKRVVEVDLFYELGKNSIHFSKINY